VIAGSLVGNTVILRMVDTGPTRRVTIRW